MKFYFFIFILLYSLFASTLEIDLEKAVNIALDNDKNIYIEQLKNDLLKKNIIEMRREYLPGINLGYNHYINRIQSSSDQRLKNIEINLVQPIWNGGKINSSIEAAKLDNKFSSIQIDSYKENLIYNIRKKFMYILQIQENLNIQKEFLILTDKQQQIAYQEYDLGLILEIDYFDILSKYKEAKINKYKLENQFAQSCNELKILLHLNYETEIKIQENLFSNIVIQSISKNLKYLIETGINNYHEIKSYEISLIKAKNELKLTRTKLIPLISLSSFYRINGLGYDSITEDYGIGINLAVPIGGNSLNIKNNLNTLKNKNNLESVSEIQMGIMDSINNFSDKLEKKIQYQAVLYNKNDHFENYKIKVSSIYQSLKLTYTEIELQKEEISTLLTRLNIIETKAGLGQIKRIDFLEALIEFNRKKIEHIKTIINYISMCNELEILLGLKIDSLKLVKINKKD